MECYYSGRGVRRTNTTQGRVGGGCNRKHCWLTELLLDRTNNFNWFFDCRNVGSMNCNFFVYIH